MTYNVWMQLPSFVNNRRPWSLVAQNVSEETAETYRETLLFPVHVELVETEEVPCASSASSSS